MSRKMMNTIVSILIVLCGVVLFNYPSIATFVNNLTANREVVDYRNVTAQMDDGELQQELAMAEAYNRALASILPADPAAAASEAGTSEEGGGARGSAVPAGSGGDSGSSGYAVPGFEDFDMLQPGAPIGYLEIPRLDLYQLIRYGTDTEVLNTGVGLVENTSLPVGGESTHAALSAHTGMATRKLFTELDRMQAGDLFFIHVRNRDLAYTVDDIRVVLPEETDGLRIREGEDLVTLVTCTPFGINDHRLLVRGVRTPYDFEKEGKSPVLQRRNRSLQWAAAFTAAAVFMVIVLAVILHDWKKKHT